MSISFAWARGACLLLFLTIIQSCQHHVDELPAPVTKLASVSIAEAQSWYQASHPSTATALVGNLRKSTTSFTQNDSDSDESALSQLVWERATVIEQAEQQLVMVPFAGDEAIFANNEYIGPRYLIITRQANNTLTGNILEVLLRRAAGRLDTVALFASLYQSYQAGRVIAPTEREGSAFFYSDDYHYLTGQQFRQGQVVADSVRLAFAPREQANAARPAAAQKITGASATNNAPPVGNICYDWYQIVDSRLVYITSTGDCYSGGSGGGNVPPVYTGGGGPAGGTTPTGPGGHGGGVSGGTSVATFKKDASLNPCAKKIVTDVITVAKNDALVGGPLANLINFIGANPNLTITFAQGAIPDKNGERVGANTTDLGNSSYKITLNTSTVSGNNRVTDLALARNIVHEMLHVYMNSWIKKEGNPVALSAGLSAALQKWQDWHGNLSFDDQHDAMVYMVGFMEQFIYTYYNDTSSSNNRIVPITYISINNQYFNDLCWGGLSETDIYKGLSLADKFRIGVVNKIENERFTGQITYDGNVQDFAPAGADICQ